MQFLRNKKDQLASNYSSISNSKGSIVIMTDQFVTFDRHLAHWRYKYKSILSDCNVNFLIIVLCLILSSQSTCCTSSSLNSSVNNSTSNLINVNKSIQLSEDVVRKEMIKAQILQKLGLSGRPEVDLAHNNKISRDLILETLHRTENLTDSSSSYGSSPVEDLEQNYAKTSEIISFPEKGPFLNGQPLLTFSYAGNHAYGVGVRIKKANLWVKMDYRSSIGRHFGHLLHPRGVTLYVFQVIGNFSNPQKMKSQNIPFKNMHLKSQDVSLELVISRTLSQQSLGWQNLDITNIVQKWYSKINRRIRHGHQKNLSKDLHKMTLLVDCSGCGNYIVPIVFTNDDSNTGGTMDENDNQQNNDQQPHGNGNGMNHHRSSVMSSRSNSISNSDDNDDSDTDLEEDDDLNSTSGGGGGKHRQQSGSGSSETDRTHSTSKTKDAKLSETPFLVQEMESSPNFKRSRRRALECSAQMKQQHCCKQRFYISFKDLGWDDWIIAPKGYYANFCRGHCGGFHRTPDTYLNYHTHVIEEYRKTSEGQESLGNLIPCCAPTKFAPMSLIYFGPDLNIIKRDLQNMIVTECGCP